LKELHNKIKNWYKNLNLLNTIALWVIVLVYATYPPTGLLLGGIPLAIYLLVLEYTKNKS